MIDLHSHILPSIDDGPITLKSSLELAVLYQKAGFSRVVATPHWIPGTTWTPSTEEIQQQVTLFNESLISKKINIHILPGMEIALDLNIAELLLNKHLLTLAGSRYVLIESPFQRLPLGWDQMFFAIMAKGYRIVLAHPERCFQLFTSPELYDDIIEKGIFFQVNYDSFLGNYGSKVSETAFYLLKKGYIHLLSTDSHDPLQRHPGNVAKAVKVLKELIDADSIEMLTRINPERVINNTMLEKIDSVNFLPEKRRRWWWF
jgi:protein-tyrosine phosphatase